MKKMLIGALLSCFLFGHSCAQDANLQSVKKNYQREILKTMKKENVVGVSLLVLNRDGVVWQESFGYADKARQLKVDENTPFGIGSITKVFTAVATLKAQEQNHWHLDDPLSNHLPFAPQSGDKTKVTLRSILLHQSGIPADLFAGMFNDQPIDYQCVLNTLNTEQLSGTPGSIRAYSNPAFTLLGLGLAKVTGQKYEDYIRQTLLHPLGMTQTHFDCQNAALSKTYNAQGEWAPDACLRDVPAGGLYSTAKDMGKWAQALLNEDARLLNPASFASMFSIQNQDSPLDFDNTYGLSWSLQEKPFVGPYWSHTGTTLNYNASLVVAKKVGLAIVILTNSQNGGRIYRLGSSILRDIAKAQGQNLKPAPKPELGSKKRIELSPAQLDAFTGVYAQPGLLIPLKRSGNQLTTRIEGFKTSLIPVGEGVFVPKVWLWGVIPIRLGNTRFYLEKVAGYDLLTQREAGSTKEILGVKMPTQVLQNWEQLAGNYTNAKPSSHEIPLLQSLEIKKEQGIMVIYLRMYGNEKAMIVPLDIQSPNLARTAGLGRYAGATVEVLTKNATQTLIKIFGMTLMKKS